MLFQCKLIYNYTEKKISRNFFNWKWIGDIVRLQSLLGHKKDIVHRRKRRDYGIFKHQTDIHILKCLQKNGVKQIFITIVLRDKNL